MRIVFILANSEDPDEMPPDAAFHLGLHSLPKDLFMGVQNKNGLLHEVKLTLKTPITKKLSAFVVC